MREDGERNARGRISNQPMIPLCLAVTAGIVCDRWMAPGQFVLFISAIAGLGLWLLAFRRGRTTLGAALILVALSATAALWHHLTWRMYAKTDLGFCAQREAQPACLEARASTSPRHQAALPADPLSTMPPQAESRVLVDVQRLRIGTRWRAASGRAMLTVKGRLTGIQCGDQLRIYAMLSLPPEPLNPGERSSADYERTQRRLCRLHTSEPECVQVLEPGDRWRLAFWMNWLRERFDDYLWQHVKSPRAGLSCAILLGTREDVDPQRNEDFLTTGTIHLLAISGLNVGILAYAFWMAGRLGLMRRAATLISGIAFVTWYALLTDAQPPVVRAAVLVTVMCLAKLWGRQSLSFNTLAAAGVVVLALNPTSLFLAGTQLSFLAVATMACIPFFSRARDDRVDPLQRLIAESRPWPWRFARRISLAIWQSIILSTVIWLVTLPLVMYRFHVVSPIATVLNPVVCLPMAVALFAGFGVLIFGWFAPPIAGVCGWICDVSLWAMEWSIDQALKVPGNHFWGPQLPAWWVAAFYVGLTLMLACPRRELPRRWLWAFISMWLALGTCFTFGPPCRLGLGHPNKLVCTFIAVGHGTSVLLQLPDGRALLYDAGRLGASYSGARPISSVLWSSGITHLDALVISHADADHFNAVPYLLKRFSVGVVYVSPTMFQGSQPAVIELQQALDRHGLEVRVLSWGDCLRTGQDCDIRVLHPPPAGVPGSDNANSIVLLVEYAGRRMLLPGDLESPGMEELLGTAPIDCDVLMAPHHGSIRSDPSGFAAWSRPEAVIISGGAGRDASPVRRSYETAGARVYHTAFDGAVRVTITAQDIEVDAYHSDGFDDL